MLTPFLLMEGMQNQSKSESVLAGAPCASGTTDNICTGPRADSIYGFCLPTWWGSDVNYPGANPFREQFFLRSFLFMFSGLIFLTLKAASLKGFTPLS